MELLPNTNEQYETKEYWDQRYRKRVIPIDYEAPDASFDWFKSYSQLSDIIHEFVMPDSRILMLGCGNSTLSEEMYDAGYTKITNVDFSPVLIENMRAKHTIKRPGMQWLEMDVRSLTFERNSFDVAIDKGTMDAMMTTKGDVWNPSPQVIENCTKEVDEVLRVLCSETGVFLYLTFGQPHFRRRYLQRDGTTLHVRELGDAFHYYLYVLLKMPAE
ncbi:S-adenosyl-L-methionine-dependent methyltransferase [Gautieria morchelliformis]|nr:S-adenosyl-L-methionine-dependent methyltransferase [Gautieria morchelliformis]